MTGGQGRQTYSVCIIAALLVAVVCLGMPAVAQPFREALVEDPVVRCILTNGKTARAWVDLSGQRYHVVPGETVAKRWVVEEIRRDTILFRGVHPTPTFLSAPLTVVNRATYHRDWSFWGEPLGLWEGLEILTTAFKRPCLMHHEAGGTVVPRYHGQSLEQFMRLILPQGHRYADVGPVMIVLPKEVNGEGFMTLIKRWAAFKAERMIMRFPGLAKAGSILSRGDDLQYVIRQISYGSSVPMQFPKDLHLPVYAHLPDLPFYVILSAVVYGNGCYLIERTDGFEIRPWTRPYTASPLPERPELNDMAAPAYLPPAMPPGGENQPPMWPMYPDGPVDPGVPRLPNLAPPPGDSH